MLRRGAFRPTGLTLLRPTPVRSAAPGPLRATTPKQSMLNEHQDWMHYWIPYYSVHDLSLDHVYPPGTPHPRQRYWWRRVYSRLFGIWRIFARDNIYEEEIPCVFYEPIPGGHGDRFTHSWQGSHLPANTRAYFAKVLWERDNLTPEQCAAKYGVYVPRQQKGPLFLGNLFFATIWFWTVFCPAYHDQDTVMITHPNLDDWIRELGGIEPITEDDQYLEQWFHPWHDKQHLRRHDAHYMYKPLMKDNVVEHATPSGGYLRGSYDYRRHV